MAQGNRTVEAPAVNAMSCLRAASMHITTASEAGPQLRCRLSMLVITMETIGVGVRVMTTKIVHLALCILIFRRDHRDQMGSRRSAQTDRLGTVSKPLMFNVVQQSLMNFRWWPNGLLQADCMSTDVDVWIPVELYLWIIIKPSRLARY